MFNKSYELIILITLVVLMLRTIKNYINILLRTTLRTSFIVVSKRNILRAGPLLQKVATGQTGTDVHWQAHESFRRQHQDDNHRARFHL